MRLLGVQWGTGAGCCREDEQGMGIGDKGTPVDTQTLFATTNDEASFRTRSVANKTGTAWYAGIRFRAHTSGPCCVNASWACAS